MLTRAILPPKSRGLIREIMPRELLLEVWSKAAESEVEVF